MKRIQKKRDFERKTLQTVIDRILKKRGAIQVLAGPRQVGKTTMMRQLAAKNLCFTMFYSAEQEVVPDYLWIDRIWQKARDTMEERGEKTAILIIDEVQRVEDWSQRVKAHWDKDTWDKLDLRVILLGSSRLLLKQGLTESLMGRFEIIPVDHWSLAEMQEIYEITPEEYIWFGGYPGAAEYTNDEERYKLYVRDSIIETSITKDILMLTRIDKPELLRQLFEIGTIYSSQIVSYTKILGQLQGKGNAATLIRYGDTLSQSQLLTPLNRYSTNQFSIRKSTPKFQTHNMALFSTLLNMTFAEAKQDHVLWGRMIESAVGAWLLSQANHNPYMKVFYWRDRSVEVDFVVQHGNKLLAIEVKSTVLEEPIKNLEVFRHRFPKVKTLVVGADALADVTWQDFLKTNIMDFFD